MTGILDKGVLDGLKEELKKPFLLSPVDKSLISAMKIMKGEIKELQAREVVVETLFNIIKVLELRLTHLEQLKEKSCEE